MKYTILYLIIIISLYSCASVPVTGRSQLNIVSDNQMLSMSLSQYDSFLKENKVSQDKEKTALVKQVGYNIQQAVESYFRSVNLEDELKNYQWEFNLVDSKEVNAWCMPGGKVVIYSGILPVTQDETGLAVVMGHEIAHAIAKHGNERMSHGMLAQFGEIALSEAVRSQPDATQGLYMTAFGIGSQLGVLLPYSRLHESEADRLGMIFMAMAGYDPTQAVSFWKRMSESSSGGKPPEILSTHPSDNTRISKIRSYLPEALGYYNTN